MKICIRHTGPHSNIWIYTRQNDPYSYAWKHAYITMALCHGNLSPSLTLCERNVPVTSKSSAQRAPQAELWWFFLLLDRTSWWRNSRVVDVLTHDDPLLQWKLPLTSGHIFHTHMGPKPENCPRNTSTTNIGIPHRKRQTKYGSKNAPGERTWYEITLPLINIHICARACECAFMRASVCVCLFKELLAYGSGHGTVAVLLPGFAINW